MTSRFARRCRWAGLALVLLLVVAVVWFRSVPADVAAWREAFERTYVGRDLHAALAQGLMDEAFRHGHSVAFEWDLPRRKPEPDEPAIGSMRFQGGRGERTAVIRVRWFAGRFRS